MPTITQFEIFVKVIDEGGFTKAAQALHMSQPAVSHAISACESELGVTLLVRAWEGFNCYGYRETNSIPNKKYS